MNSLIKKEDNYRFTRMRIDRCGNRIIEVLEVNKNQDPVLEPKEKTSLLETTYLLSVSILGFCASFYIMENLIWS